MARFISSTTWCSARQTPLPVVTERSALKTRKKTNRKKIQPALCQTQSLLGNISISSNVCQTVVCEKSPGEKWKKEFFCVVMVYLEATVAAFFFIISMQVCRCFL